MDTSIYIGPVLQLLPRTVNVWGDAPLSKKILEGISDYSTLYQQNKSPTRAEYWEMLHWVKKLWREYSIIPHCINKISPHKSWIIINFSSISFSIQMAPCNLPGKFLASNLKRTYTSAGLVCIMITMRSFILIPCCLFI
jgi:hypothetical protein